MKPFLVFFSILISTTAPAQIDSSPYGFKGIDQNLVSECPMKAALTRVSLFKQWHLAPNVDTKVDPPSEAPQTENQMWIYTHLVDAINEGSYFTVIVEGCSGEIDEKFAKSFNGWKLDDLKEASKTTRYNSLLTHIGLKLKAKFGNKIRVLCGDDEKAVEDSNLAMSDIRGYVGFATRIVESKSNPVKMMEYISAASNTLKLPKTSSGKTVGEELRKRALESLKKFKSLIEVRNTAFVQAIERAKDQRLAVVVGGLHAEGLLRQFEQKKFSCLLIQPEGYPAKDDSLLKSLETAILSWQF